jgi:hypothetical protein
VRNIILLLLVLSIGVWLWAVDRETTLFVVRVKEGRLTHVRGRIPPRVLDEIRDVVARASVRKARIKAFVRDGRPTLRLSGEFDPNFLQVLRNVVGQYSVAEFRAARNRSN